MANDSLAKASQWFGTIPDNWSAVRLGGLFTLRNTKVSDRDYPPLSVSRGGIVPQMENVAKSDASDDRKLVLAGDFVINSRSDRKGSCGVSELDGSVSLINLVLCPNNPDTTYGPYLNYLLKNHGFAEEFYRWGHGIVADLWTTRWQEMKSIYLPVPSLLAQKKIASFLLKKCAQIDRLIEVEESQIEKLGEYRQELISKVVTEGLNPNAKRKEVCMPWFKIIPQHWIVKRVKYIATSFAKGSGITKEDIIADGNISCVRYGDIYTKYERAFIECAIKTDLARIPSPQYFEYGDILFSGTGELVEEIGKNIVYLGKEKCLAGGDVIIMTHEQDPTFLNYALSSTNSQMQKSCGKAKLKVVHISATEIGNLLLALPPLSEQRAISEYLDKKCATISKIINIKHAKILALREYKKSLIYEYVTGKKELS